MEINNDKQPYDLNELINKLEDIRDAKDDALNLPRAFYTLALEVAKLKGLYKESDISLDEQL